MQRNQCEPSPRNRSFDWADPLTQVLVNNAGRAWASVVQRSSRTLESLLGTRLSFHGGLTACGTGCSLVCMVVNHTVCLNKAVPVSFTMKVAQAAKASCGFAAPLVDIPGNERAYARLVRRSAFLHLDFTYIQVPIRRHKGGFVERVAWPVFLPHEFFGALVDAGLARLLQSQPHDALVFWQNAKHEPWARDHPVYQLPESQWQDIIPIRLHGDEGTGAKKRPVMVLSWQSVLIHAPAWLSRFLVCVIPSKFFVYGPRGENQTIEPIYDAIRTSLCCLLAGRWPDAPFKRLGAEGRKRYVKRHQHFAFQGRVFRCAFAGVKGDGKFHRFTFLPTRHYGAAFVCWHCFAHRRLEPLVYTDVSLTAGWRATCESHAQWEATRRRRGLFRSAILDIPGFHKTLVHDDLMHVLYLGVAQDVCASILASLVDRGRFGTLDRETGLLFAHAEFVAFSKSHGYDPWLDKLTPVTMKWSAREFPELPGKAADAKWMVAFLAAKLRALPAQSSWDTVAACAVCSLANAVAVFDHAGMWLSPEEMRAAAAHGQVFMECYMALARDAFANRACLFKVRPKLHVLHHVFLSLEGGVTRANPRFTQNFTDEDFIGQIATLTRVTHQRTVAARTLERYLGHLQASLVAAGIVVAA